MRSVAAGELVGQRHRVVLEEVPELGLVVVADRLLERDRRPAPCGGSARPPRRACRARARSRPTVGSRPLLGAQLALGAQDPVQLLDDVHGHPDRPPLVGERARDGLADPPGRVGRELEALAVVELLGRAHEPDRPLLDQVEERQPLVAVALGDRDDQSEVRLDHLLLRAVVAALDPLRELDLLRGGQQVDLADVLQEELQRVGRDLRPRPPAGSFSSAAIASTDWKPSDGSTSTWSSTTSSSGSSSKNAASASTLNAPSGPATQSVRARVGMRNLYIGARTDTADRPAYSAAAAVQPASSFAEKRSQRSGRERSSGPASAVCWNCTTAAFPWPVRRAGSRGSSAPPGSAGSAWSAARAARTTRSRFVLVEQADRRGDERLASFGSLPHRALVERLGGVLVALELQHRAAHEQRVVARRA